jgi:hypothetical protein
MICDNDLDKIYNEESLNLVVYSSMLKKKQKHNCKFFLDTLELCCDSKGNKGRSIKVKVKPNSINLKNNSKLSNGSTFLIFPKLSFAIMFKNSNIDIRKDEGVYEIEFMIKSEREYLITKKNLICDKNYDVDEFDNNEKQHIDLF